MSLFLQTLVLRDILSSEQDHRQGLKRRVETCIQRYEQYELFRLT
jgi:hypothetical protein